MIWHDTWQNTSQKSINESWGCFADHAWSRCNRNFSGDLGHSAERPQPVTISYQLWIRKSPIHQFLTYDLSIKCKLSGVSHVSRIFKPLVHCFSGSWPIVGSGSPGHDKFHRAEKFHGRHWEFPPVLPWTVDGGERSGTEAERMSSMVDGSTDLRAAIRWHPLTHEIRWSIDLYGEK